MEARISVLKQIGEKKNPKHTEFQIDTCKQNIEIEFTYYLKQTLSVWTWCSSYRSKLFVFLCKCEYVYSKIKQIFDIKKSFLVFLVFCWLNPQQFSCRKYAYFKSNINFFIVCFVINVLKCEIIILII